MRECEAPRLLADAMLGKLARWLRLMGYDTGYLQADDAAVAARARAEGRVLLTRDRGLAARRGLRVVLLASQDLTAQLVAVVRAVGVLPEGIAPRCMGCNVPLEAITPAEVQGQVPDYVAATELAFHRCPKCGKITWRGSHWTHIQAVLQQVRAAVGADSEPPSDV